MFSWITTASAATAIAAGESFSVWSEDVLSDLPELIDPMDDIELAWLHGLEAAERAWAEAELYGAK